MISLSPSDPTIVGVRVDTVQKSNPEIYSERIRRRYYVVYVSRMAPARHDWPRGLYNQVVEIAYTFGSDPYGTKLLKQA